MLGELTEIAEGTGSRAFSADELHAMIALSLIEGVGAKRLISAIERFGSAASALEAFAHQLEQIEGFGPLTAQAVTQGREEAKRKADRQVALMTGSRIAIRYDDPRYPIELRKIYDPPALLYLEGNASLLSAPRRLAIIGTRKVTDYGRRMTSDLVATFARQQVVVVSGFAQGVDTCAHRSAFESGGETIGVLGSGLDVIYPKSNKAFATELVSSERGLLISELPFGAPPDARNFPWRNRIVSGLSKGVVVVESDEKGGSMITAAIALDQNREIFAIPGDLGRYSSNGPNLLIRESRAKLARSAEDILGDLGWLNASESKEKRSNNSARRNLTLFESNILAVLDDAGEPLHIDTLAERAGQNVQDILVQLLSMEFKGIVRQLAGKQFSSIP